MSKEEPTGIWKIEIEQGYDDRDTGYIIRDIIGTIIAIIPNNLSLALSIVNQHNTIVYRLKEWIV